MGICCTTKVKVSADQVLLYSLCCGYEMAHPFHKCNVSLKQPHTSRKLCHGCQLPWYSSCLSRPIKDQSLSISHPFLQILFNFLQNDYQGCCTAIEHIITLPAALLQELWECWMQIEHATSSSLLHCTENLWKTSARNNFRTRQESSTLTMMSDFADITCIIFSFFVSVLCVALLVNIWICGVPCC